MRETDRQRLIIIRVISIISSLLSVYMSDVILPVNYNFG